MRNAYPNALHRIGVRDAHSHEGSADQARTFPVRGTTLHHSHTQAEGDQHTHQSALAG
jgi:hypothetical protein